MNSPLGQASILGGPHASLYDYQMQQAIAQQQMNAYASQAAYGGGLAYNVAPPPSPSDDLVLLLLDEPGE